MVSPAEPVTSPIFSHSALQEKAFNPNHDFKMLTASLQPYQLTRRQPPCKQASFAQKRPAWPLLRHTTHSLPCTHLATSQAYTQQAPPSRTYLCCPSLVPGCSSTEASSTFKLSGSPPPPCWLAAAASFLAARAASYACAWRHKTGQRQAGQPRLRGHTTLTG